MTLSSSVAQKLVADILAESRTKSLNPMSVVVLDGRGALMAAASEDGTSLMRWKIAMGKASGALAMGLGSRRIAAMATERPFFVASLHGLAADGLVPVPGGVLLRTADKAVIGAIGVSGDTSDNDEAVALAAIAHTDLVGDPG